jgi:hypothetical protein
MTSKYNIPTEKAKLRSKSGGVSQEVGGEHMNEQVRITCSTLGTDVKWGAAEKQSRPGTGEWGDGTKRLYNYCSHTAKVVGWWSETRIVGVSTSRVQSSLLIFILKKRIEIR